MKHPKRINAMARHGHHTIVHIAHVVEALRDNLEAHQEPFPKNSRTVPTSTNT